MDLEKRNVSAEIYDEFKDYGFLTPAEKDIFKGVHSKRAKELQENGVRKALGIVLGSEQEVVLEDGSKVTVTNAERLAARVYQEAMQNPSTSKLKDIAHIMGEDKVTIEGKLDGGADIFLGIVKDGEKEEEVVEPNDSNS